MTMSNTTDQEMAIKNIQDDRNETEREKEKSAKERGAPCSEDAEDRHRALLLAATESASEEWRFL